MFFRSIIISILFCCLTKSVNSQNAFYPIDTIEHNNKKVVLFSNNRWFFMDDPQFKKDTIEEYNSHWETKDIFAYLNERGRSNDYYNFDLTTVNPDNFTMPRIGKFYRGVESHHSGLDIGLKMGDSVIAAFDGKVRYAQYHNRGYGNMVIIRHPNGLETWYAHLSKIKVKENQYVKSGDLIGLGGMTGRATSPHLHFESRYHDRAFDPLTFIDYDHHKLSDDIPYKSLFINGRQPLTNPKDSAKSNDSIHINSTVKKQTTIVKPKKPVKFYVIKQGDTLSAIAKKNHITVNAICQANNITVKTMLKSGKKIMIP